MASRTRVNSQFLRELTCGKFIIRYEQLTLLDNIGQGKYCNRCMCLLHRDIYLHVHVFRMYMYVHAGEFGIVYKARLGSQGKADGEVAVKTLKGQ